MSPDAVDLTGIAVAIGRVEEKVSHLAGMEDRLRKVEEAITKLEAQQKPRTPWWVVAGGVAATLTALAGFWSLFNLASEIAAAIP